MIEVEKLGKSFSGKPFLVDFDLQVPKGETLSLLGPSGSGKSTLLRCLNGLETFDAGLIRIDGIEVSADLPAREKKRRIEEVRIRTGMVFQRFHLFPHLSVLENVMSGPLWVKKVPRAECEKIARERLEEVGMLAKATRYPETLSGGECQRVALARSLAMKPRVVLLDEPTSALDPENVGEVADVIIKLAERGETMVLVTHNLDLARAVSHRVIFMESGRIVESGPPSVVLENPRSERTRDFLERDNLLSGLRREPKK